MPDTDTSSPGDHPWAQAVRRAFLLTLPLVLSGAVALLVLNLPIPGYQAAMDARWGPDWRVAVQSAWQASLGLLSVAVVFATSHALAVIVAARQRIDTNPVAVALVALCCYFILVLPGKGLLASELAVPRGVFLSVLVGVATTEIFLCLRRVPGLDLSMLAEADSELPAVLKSILPGMLTIGLFFLIQHALIAPHARSADAVTDQVLGWLFGLSDNALLRTILFVVLAHLLWFVGIHGNNALELFYRDYLVPASEANIHALQAGQAPPEIITNAFVDTFVLLGGSGATIGLLIPLLAITRGSRRRLAWLAAPPALFNINEILIFGLPIVFNPTLLLPFLLAPLVSLLVAWGAVVAGFVPANASHVTWTTPILLNAWLATDTWKGVALQVLNIGLCTALYLPFVRRNDRLQRARTQLAFGRLISSMQGILVQPGQQLLGRTDEIGSLARSLAARLEHDLRSGRIYLAYQPKLDLTGQVSGVEALLRWDHPLLGGVPAHVAVAIVEDAGKINAVGDQVLEMACRQLRQWQETGLDGIEMAVNVSPLQLEDPAFAARVERCLARHRLAPGALEIEITEGHLVSSTETSARNLSALGALGVRLAMDDFGMGYSSLLYMRRFHIDAVKLDGSLTREVLHNASCREIIASVGQLCRSQDVRLVAEYVETQDQRDLLASLGCDSFQGWLYSPAVSPEACRAYIEAQQAGARQDSRATA